MYKNISFLVLKSLFASQANCQNIYGVSQNVRCTKVIHLCTSANKRVRFQSRTSEDVKQPEQTTDDQNSSRHRQKVSAKELLNDAATFVDQVPANEESKWSTAPYPEGSIPRSQAHHSLKPRIDPRETSIILFPGEGNQFVGMGKELVKFPTCRDLFEVANQILKFNLIKLCLQGPKSELDKTANTQVSMLVCSLAAIERLKEEQPSAIENCIATAGFGVGELTALVFAGVISFERAVRLAQLRGEAMQMASDMAPGGLMTVLYGPDAKVGYALKRAVESAKADGIESPYCSVANYLFPHCKVIGGNKECLNFIEQNTKEFNFKKVRRLPVPGAFYTELMRPAAHPFRQALQKTNLKDPLIAVHSNFDGKRYKDKVHVVKQLPKQIYRPVKWEQTLHILYERPDGDNFPRTFECGPGNSLKEILKMVNAKAWNSCIEVS